MYIFHIIRAFHLALSGHIDDHSFSPFCEKVNRPAGLSVELSGRPLLSLFLFFFSVVSGNSSICDRWRCRKTSLLQRDPLGVYLPASSNSLCILFHHGLLVVWSFHIIRIAGSDIVSTEHIQLRHLPLQASPRWRHLFVSQATLHLTTDNHFFFFVYCVGWV